MRHHHRLMRLGDEWLGHRPAATRAALVHVHLIRGSGGCSVQQVTVLSAVGTTAVFTQTEPDLVTLFKTKRALPERRHAF